MSVVWMSAGALRREEPKAWPSIACAASVPPSANATPAPSARATTAQAQSAANQQYARGVGCVHTKIDRRLRLGPSCSWVDTAPTVFTPPPLSRTLTWEHGGTA